MKRKILSDRTCIDHILKLTIHLKTKGHYFSHRKVVVWTAVHGCKLVKKIIRPVILSIFFYRMSISKLWTWMRWDLYCSLSECSSLTGCEPRGIRTFDSIIAYLPDENTSIIMTDISVLSMISISCNFALMCRAEHALKVVDVIFHVQDVIMLTTGFIYTAYA